jgi:hypothetical protein
MAGFSGRPRSLWEDARDLRSTRDWKIKIDGEVFSDDDSSSYYSSDGDEGRTEVNGEDEQPSYDFLKSTSDDGALGAVDINYEEIYHHKRTLYETMSKGSNTWLQRTRERLKEQSPLSKKSQLLEGRLTGGAVESDNVADANSLGDIEDRAGQLFFRSSDVVDEQGRDPFDQIINQERAGSSGDGYIPEGKTSSSSLSEHSGEAELDDSYREEIKPLASPASMKRTELGAIIARASTRAFEPVPQRIRGFGRDAEREYDRARAMQQHKITGSWVILRYFAWGLCASL